MATELAGYDRQQVLGALRRCRRELKGRLTMAAVIERLDDGRPGAEEAWAQIPKSESETAVWTTEAAQAYGVAAPLIADGDMIAARMAFKETYLRLVQDARDRAEPVDWQVSLGHDPRGRDAPIARAVELGRLTYERAQNFVPLLPMPVGAPVALIAGAVKLMR
jgi:hypothetical protein